MVVLGAKGTWISVFAVLLFSLFLFKIYYEFCRMTAKCLDPSDVDTLGNGTFFSCPYSPAVFEFIKREIPGYLADGEEYFQIDFSTLLSNENSVIFDIGANIGLFSFYAAKKFPKSTVYAFEPLKHNFETLKKNMEVNRLQNVQLHELGFSEIAKTIEFEYYEWNPGGSSSYNQADGVTSELIMCFRKMETWHRKDYVLYSFLSLPFIGDFSRFLLSIAPKPISEKVEGQLIRVSDFLDEHDEINQVDVMKIDVEGAEWDVLMGVEDRHWELVKYITMEVHPYLFERSEDGLTLGERIKEFLEKKGFFVKLINKCEEFGYSDLQNVFQDLVAVRKEIK